MKGIDHLVLCARDFPAMCRSYEALGFTLTPAARHPFGTRNRLVQLEGCFLELLGVFEPADIPEHGEERFSFAAFNRDFLQEREGLSMLVLDSTDARADVAAFRARGLRTYEPFDFSRRARLPTGDEVTVGFSLAFATDPGLPHCAFFTCQQHAPEHFWKLAFQRHANRALTILEVTLVAERPEDHAPFLSAFSGFPAEPAKHGIRLRTARGHISCVTPQQFAESFARATPDLSKGPRFMGYTIGVSRIRDLEERAGKAGLSLLKDGPHRFVLPADVNGSALAFFSLKRQDP